VTKALTLKTPPCGWRVSIKSILSGLAFCGAWFFYGKEVGGVTVLEE